MKILLLAATQFEIEPFLQHKHHGDVLISGVGIPATTFHLTKKLSHHHYDLVIQAGVGGSFSNTLSLGEVVCVAKDAFGDLGVYEQQAFKSLNDMQLSNELEWFNHQADLKSISGLKKVKGITVHTVTDDVTIIKALRQKWNADVESMEGAAAAYVCHQKNIPFLQLRAISNFVGERDKSKWQIKQAIENLNTVLEQVLLPVAVVH